MAKILGLDLGTNSIGWAVVDEDQEKILNTGVRIYPEGVLKDTIGKGEKEVSKNATRRDNRQKRRGFYRDRLRRIALLKTLIDFEMCPLTLEMLYKWKRYDKKIGNFGKTFPDTPEFRMWLKMNPYDLRKKALDSDLTLHELGRIYYHFIQHRGFLSNRKSNDDGKIYTGKDGVTGIDKTKEQIKDKTLGAYLYEIVPKENEPFKKIADSDGNELRARARYTLREMYVQEFEQIWQRQAEQLGLNSVTVPVKRTIFIEGGITNKRNKAYIEHKIRTLGQENVEIREKQITVTETMPLKVYLGGEIEYDEDNTLKFKSGNSVLFYQRPLRSQKGLLGKCSLEGRKVFDKKLGKIIETGPTPCPLSHPEYEEFRALQFINNIEYGRTKNLKSTAQLDEFQRKILLDLFASKESFDFTEIRKKLELHFEPFNYEDSTKIPGSPTISKLSKLFKPEIWEKHKEEIWHSFYFFDDSEKLYKKLKDKFGLMPEKNQTEKELIDKISKIKQKDGYASVSLKAIRNITQFLKKGYKYSYAVLLGGVRNAFKTTDAKGESYDRWDNFKHRHDEIENRIIEISNSKNNAEFETIKKIKAYLTAECGFEEHDKNFKKLYHHSQETEQKPIKDKLGEIENLRNPIVQQGLHELRRLVNTLIEKYGKFDYINLEFGRDLKVGKQKREEISRKIGANEKLNNKAREKLTEYGLAHSRYNVQRYLMWAELEEKNGTAKCPYTGKTININDALGTENKFQIEHIFPHSTSLDDSFANKTLCDAKFNAEKGNQTPWEFYQINSDPNLWNAKSWDDISRRAFKLLPYAKAKRFTNTKKIELTDDFLSRQLNDTRYISKKAREILSEICPKNNIRILPGALTAELRRLWGINSILNTVNDGVLDFANVKIVADKPQEHWIISDKDNKVINVIPKFYDKPKTASNQMCLSGELNDKGEFTAKYFGKTFKSEHPEYFGKPYAGKYWKIVTLSEKPVSVSKAYNDEPQRQENEIIINGEVKGKKFGNANTVKNISADLEDGKYFVKFKVLSKRFDKSDTKGKPKTGTGEIALFGEVNAAVFKSYIYECACDKGDGGVWGIFKLDFENPEFTKREIAQPDSSENQIVVSGTVNESGVFVSDADKTHDVQTDLTEGKYWFVFDISEHEAELYRNEHPKPDKQKDAEVGEGTVWVNEQTGEIQYDPKKNRDDHRHHAIDAITVAFTKLNYLNELSKYNAQLSEKQRGKATKPDFPKPWDNFREDVARVAENILISHRQNRKVITKIKKTIRKNGRKIQSEGYAVNGQLHKENIYGKRKAPGESKPKFHIRKDVASLTDAQIKKIVDTRIKEIVIHAKAKEKELLKNIDSLSKELKRPRLSEQDEQNLLNDLKSLRQEIRELYTLSNKNGEPVPIKKVRISENLSNTEQLKNMTIVKEKSGKTEQINQHVNPRNNHHVALYRTQEGELFEEMVTFWEAVERKNAKLPVINKVRADGAVFVESLQENDMFLLGIPEDYINWNEPNHALLSNHLYRVQKISSMYYTFRHHLASTINNPEQEFRVHSFSAWDAIKPIKVKINEIGEISKA